MQKSTFADAAAKLGAAKARAEQAGDTARVQKINAALDALFARQQQVNGNHGAQGEASFAVGGDPPGKKFKPTLGFGKTTDLFDNTLTAPAVVVPPAPPKATTLPEVVVRAKRSRPAVASAASGEVAANSSAMVPYDPQKTLDPFLSPELKNLLFPEKKAVTASVPSTAPTKSSTGKSYQKPGWLPSAAELSATASTASTAAQVAAGLTPAIGRRQRRGVVLTDDQKGNLAGTAANLLTMVSNDKQLDELGREQTAPRVAQPAYTYTDRSRGRAEEINASARRAMNAVEGTSTQGVNANRQAMLATELGALNQNAAQEAQTKDAYDARFAGERGQVAQTNAYLESQTSAQNRQGRAMRAEGKIANRAALLQAFDDNAQQKADHETQAAQYAIMAPAIDGGRGLQAGQVEQMKTLARQGNKSVQALLKAQNIAY